MNGIHWYEGAVVKQTADLNCSGRFTSCKDAMAGDNGKQKPINAEQDGP